MEVCTNYVFSRAPLWWEMAQKLLAPACFSDRWQKNCPTDQKIDSTGAENRPVKVAARPQNWSRHPAPRPGQPCAATSALYQPPLRPSPSRSSWRPVWAGSGPVLGRAANLTGRSRRLLNRFSNSWLFFLMPPT